MKIEINENNAFVESYNRTVDSILTNGRLQEDFFTILDEQKAILIIDGGVSEGDAEAYVCQPDNLRRTALYFANYRETTGKNE